MSNKSFETLVMGEKKCITLKVEHISMFHRISN